MHSDSRLTVERQLASLRQALEMLRCAKHHDERRTAIQAVQQQLAALEAAYRRSMVRPGRNTGSRPSQSILVSCGSFRVAQKI